MPDTSNAAPQAIKPTPCRKALKDKDGITGGDVERPIRTPVRSCHYGVSRHKAQRHKPDRLCRAFGAVLREPNQRDDSNCQIERGHCQNGLALGHAVSGGNRDNQPRCEQDARKPDATAPSKACSGKQAGYQEAHVNHRQEASLGQQRVPQERQPQFRRLPRHSHCPFAAPLLSWLFRHLFRDHARLRCVAVGHKTHSARVTLLIVASVICSVRGCDGMGVVMRGRLRRHRPTSTLPQHQAVLQ